VSLATFPATAGDLIAASKATGAPNDVTAALEGLQAQTTFDNARDLWVALDLAAQERF
jgi:hypothetical protein